ncbi:Meiotically up-regulated gene 113 [Mitsuaria sp. PDC51]|uniref:GIY-YIG nuclease family protein n=1 Tax=Mitsuaria sp. PDC51 TaxID=1881035 RepID=UPI0008F0C4D5|nr:GIY-YIG nuclease family protein [Mitsuaria sp. PDC51]SFR74914.1 Meiotically up-regulated gene 113 [Mitsuaria sp. PDC51]
MLTPKKYWRLPVDIDDESVPRSAFTLPSTISGQSRPPAVGDGVVLAAYDIENSSGLFRWVGVVTGIGVGPERMVDWRPASEEIYVDTVPGRGYWRKGAFGFADSKVAGYGLHEVWAHHFGLELRDHAKVERMPRAPRSVGPTRSGISKERLVPVEIIGTPTVGPKAGVVYVLKSAYGYKVGRTNNVPSRMRAFGVQLPFAYSIPFCIWFKDCHAAERSFHRQFSDRHINGEWFDLGEDDLSNMRSGPRVMA